MPLLFFLRLIFRHLVFEICAARPHHWRVLILVIYRYKRVLWYHFHGRFSCSFSLLVILSVHYNGNLVHIGIRFGIIVRRECLFYLWIGITYEIQRARRYISWNLTLNQSLLDTSCFILYKHGPYQSWLYTRYKRCKCSLRIKNETEQTLHYSIVREMEEKNRLKFGF